MKILNLVVQYFIGILKEALTAIKSMCGLKKICWLEVFQQVLRFLLLIIIILISFVGLLSFLLGLSALFLFPSELLLFSSGLKLITSNHELVGVIVVFLFVVCGVVAMLLWALCNPRLCCSANLFYDSWILLQLTIKVAAKSWAFSFVCAIIGLLVGLLVWALYDDQPAFQYSKEFAIYFTMAAQIFSLIWFPTTVKAIIQSRNA